MLIEFGRKGTVFFANNRVFLLLFYNKFFSCFFVICNFTYKFVSKIKCNHYVII